MVKEFVSSLPSNNTFVCAQGDTKKDIDKKGNTATQMNVEGRVDSKNNRNGSNRNLNKRMQGEEGKGCIAANFLQYQGNELAGVDTSHSPPSNLSL